MKVLIIVPRNKDKSKVKVKKVAATPYQIRNGGAGANIILCDIEAWNKAHKDIEPYVMKQGIDVRFFRLDKEVT